MRRSVGSDEQQRGRAHRGEASHTQREFLQLFELPNPSRRQRHDVIPDRSAAKLLDLLLGHLDEVAKAYDERVVESGAHQRDVRPERAQPPREDEQHAVRAKARDEALVADQNAHRLSGR